MKKLAVIVILIFLLISNIVFIGMTVLYKSKIVNQAFRVYSFDGENSDIKISDGIIIIYNNKQIVDGGKMQYIGNKQERVKSYSKNIYINKQGSKKKILSNAVSFEVNSKEITFNDEFLLNKDIREISSDNLFSEEDINIMEDNLYFSLHYSTDEEKEESIIIKLKLKEFNMN
ncbi:hypothetical protein CLPUN_00210 [Clostridium puniceum]|uniref:Uncharacterized protein n=1 Tax=Clostridium puniceum TaxID=29367 RepID=A0A1S8TXY1_9CLOT|nr:hypothetical protein [Clostridium puniceum]OOM82601.1 hypothetical protein CLPUN_00210 [Clostridium puniceum]